MSDTADLRAVQRERARALLTDLATMSVDDPARADTRAELATMHLPLVHHLAHRYRHRGEPYDDVVQAGTEGLLKAIDRFDPERGAEFATYATPTILGEIKRHFRDRTWSVHVPRGVQELQAAVSSATDELTRTLQRSPTVQEIADRLDVSPEAVLDAIEAHHAYATTSYDEAPADDAPITARIAVDDNAFEAIDERESLRPLIDALPDRERRIIGMRFFHNLNQSQIAEELGISQMHVSRLLARTLTELREGLAAA
jgi:RNA polymerase sigma-B factor